MLSPCWGFGVLPNMEAYSLTKLFLDSNAELAEFDDQVLQQTVSLGNPDQTLHPDKDKPPIDVVVDYLSHVLNFVWETIQNDLGQRLNHLPVDLRFTIPATWSDRGLELSEEALIRAWDFKRPQDILTLMSEPDAAAESVHAQLKENDMLQTGDGILVCDCGSGTVVRFPPTPSPASPNIPSRLEFKYQEALLIIHFKDITTYFVMDSTDFTLSRITAVQGK